jgi:hypothetical protein
VTPGSDVVVFASTRQGWYADYAVTIAKVERHYRKGD